MPERPDPTDGFPIFCPICEADIGPVWPSPSSAGRGGLPEVIHRANGTHLFKWPGVAMTIKDPGDA